MRIKVAGELVVKDKEGRGGNITVTPIFPKEGKIKIKGGDDGYLLKRTFLYSRIQMASAGKSSSRLTTVFIHHPSLLQTL